MNSNHIINSSSAYLEVLPPILSKLIHDNADITEKFEEILAYVKDKSIRNDVHQAILRLDPSKDLQALISSATDDELKRRSFQVAFYGGSAKSPTPH